MHPWSCICVGCAASRFRWPSQERACEATMPACTLTWEELVAIREHNLEKARNRDAGRQLGAVGLWYNAFCPAIGLLVSKRSEAGPDRPQTPGPHRNPIGRAEIPTCVQTHGPSSQSSACPLVPLMRHVAHRQAALCKKRQATEESSETAGLSLSGSSPTSGSDLSS